VVVLSGFKTYDEAEIRRRFGSAVFECLHKPVAPRLLMTVTAAAADRAGGAA
jgi:hypothetical protein